MNSPDTLALVLAELVALRRDVAALLADRDRATLRAADRDALGRILPVLAGIFGRARFATWEAADLAGTRGTDGANLRLVLDGRDAKALGQLLARGAGVDIDGHRIERDGRDGDGQRWRVGVTPLSFTSAPDRPETDA